MDAGEHRLCRLVLQALLKLTPSLALEAHTEDRKALNVYTLRHQRGHLRSCMHGYEMQPAPMTSWCLPLDTKSL